MSGAEVTRAIIGAAMTVHRALGPGLLESAYDKCLACELAFRGIAFARQVPLRVEFRGMQVDCAYRVDYVVDGSVAVELKAITAIEPVHEAQLLTYMRLGGWNLGLLINFNVELLKEGIRRRIL